MYGTEELAAPAACTREWPAEPQFPAGLLSAALNSPARLAALRRLALMDTASDPVFDRYTRLVQFGLKVPAATISLVDDRRQFFKSALGLPAEWQSRRGTPLSHCFCQFAVATREIFRVCDARQHPWVCSNPGVTELRCVAYLGVPLNFYGQAVGALVAIDDQPREWTEAELEALRDLAQMLQRELRNRDVQVELADGVQRIEVERLRQATLIQTMAESVFGVDAHGRLLPLNQAARRSGMAEPDRSGRIAAQALLERALAGETLRDVEVEVADDLLSSRWHSINASPLRDANGAPAGAVLVGRDISEARRAAQQLQRQKAEIDDLYENAPCGYGSIDSQGVFTRLNRTLLGWLGYASDELVGKRHMAELLRPEFRERAGTLFEQLMATGELHDLRYELKCRDGSWLPVMASAIAEYDEAGRFVMARSTLVDFSRMAQAERQVQALLETDTLTGALNRRGFFAAFDGLLAEMPRAGLLIVYADLDGLKPINDSLGHHAGDRAISEAVDCLRRALGPAALVARMGGDEFAAALPCASAATAARLLTAVDYERRDCNRSGTLPFRLDWSVGHLHLCAGSHDTRTVDELLAEVDALMYVQKRRNKARG